MTEVLDFGSIYGAIIKRLESQSQEHDYIMCNKRDISIQK